MSHTSPEVIIVGRFPPPLDGQALATERLASMLSSIHDVVRINIEEPDSDVKHGDPIRIGRIQHFLTLRDELDRILSAHSESVVLWPSISPSMLGHIRDRIVILPSIRSSQKAVAVVHRGDFELLFTRRITSRSAMRMAKRIDRFVFLTEHLSARCARWIPEHKRTVIPNTIDQDLVFSEKDIQNRRRPRGRGPFRLLFVANMIESKGYLDVIDATRLLVASGHDIELHLAGQWMSDAGRAAFEARIAPIATVVTHHGAVSSRSEMRRLYADADAYVLPTYYENEAQPLTIIEALNAGLPVITTRHAGIPEVVSQDREALFVEPNDPHSIAAAAERLLQQSLWSEMSRQARARFVQVYAPERVGEQWIGLLNDLGHG